jgi:bifunctional UDP-N-acetylglucosamine pyrophosphorylase/glucosamine-1-phosphate N-acetyltransferase
MAALGAILAAGRGERMKITVPKPLYPILGRPLITYTADMLRAAGIGRVLAVTSPAIRAELAKSIQACPKMVVQPVPRGTGEAVMRLKPYAKGKCTLVIINADNPLFEPSQIRALLAAHARSRAQVTFATALVDDPRGLGRVLRDPDGSVANIVEEAEATDEVRRIREINAGMYAFEAPAIFGLLDAVKPAGSKKEIYLTRAVELALARGLQVATIRVPAEAAIGINTLSDAALAQAVLQARKLSQLMDNGVLIEDPSSVTIDWEVRVGAGTRILPGTILRGATSAGNGCVLGPHSVITGAKLGNGVSVKSSYITNSTVADGAAVGPFAHVRPGCAIGAGCVVGTHAECNRTRLGRNVQMHHFSYLGDATVGDRANIGAGAISANYNGRTKSPTVIGKNAFIGSGAVLVAPARVGDRGVVGAGAVLPAGRTVPPGSVFAGVPAHKINRKKGGKS